MNNNISIESVEKAINALKNGKPIIVVDDLDRENEGDLIFPAEDCTTDMISYFLNFTSGVICCSITEKRALDLNLQRMVENNTDKNQTAFTVSVDYSIGTTTGISASDRSKTILALANVNDCNLFTKPGHMFPLIAKNGGVLDRNGHTEASIDFMKLAGKKECAILAEIVTHDKKDMAKLQELKKLAKTENLVLTSIKDLQNYLKSNELKSNSLKIESECNIHIKRNNFNEIIKFISIKNDKKEFLILKKGNLEDSYNVPVRIHSGCITGDIFNSQRCDCGHQLDYFFDILSNNDNGMLIYIESDEGRGIGLFKKLKAYSAIENQNLNTYSANEYIGEHDDLREFNYLDSIINLFKIKSINLYTNNPNKISSTSINKVINIPTIITNYNFNYLKTKQEHKSHSLKLNAYSKLENNNKISNLKDKKIAIIHSNWYSEYILNLVDGCVNKLKEYSCDNIKIKSVSGSFDLIAGLIQLLKNEDYSCVILIGIILKGETSHNTFLMNSIGYGIMKAQLKYSLPIINGILTCDTEEQIKQRSLFNNHGVHWASATNELFSD